MNRITTRIMAIFVLLGVFSPMAFADQAWQPRADGDAIVSTGNARFTVLTPHLIRLEYAKNGQFSDQASLTVVHRKLPVPDFSYQVRDGWLHIATSALSLRYEVDSGPFASGNLEILFDLNGKQQRWQPGMQDNQNLGGTARTLDGMNGGIDWNGNPLDLGQGILSKSGWALHDDSDVHRLQSDGTKDNWPWVSPPPQGDYQDWYFFAHGRNYKQALKDYTDIAGKIPLPPRYAFGYWWSRYWVYSDREFRDLMQQMRGLDIPIDVLVIDMDWHLTHGGLKDIHNPQRDPFGELLGWTGYTWNRELFPEPEKFLQWTEDFNLKTALNLHPASGISPLEEQYPAFAAQYGFDTTNQDYIPYRLAEKKWAQTYVDTVLHPLENQGIDFWWLDWQQFPESKVMPGLNNTWWLNYVFFTDMERQDKRPLLFHRWGGMGNHRYQIGFSGDDKISWESLQYQSYFTATAANVGYGYWSHDIGGHASGELDKDAELYLRWLQFGVFSPILRTHSAKISTIERRFWMYPQRFEAMRDLVKLRYRLNPYIYTAARQAYDSGISIVRPMYYDYPNTEAAYQARYQYMFGDDMLMAPIAKPVSKDSLLAAQEVWLPEGQWYEWSSGTSISGGQTETRYFAETELPLYVKAGAIIPMFPDIDHLQQQVESLHLTIVPGEKGMTRVYEDGLNDLGYKGDEFAFTDISHGQLSPTTRQVVISPRQGVFRGALDKRQISLILPASFPIKSVTVNGEPLAAELLSYDASQLANVVQLPANSVADKLDIRLVTDQQYQGKQAILNGKIGQFNRVTQAVSDLKVEVARENWWASLPDMVLGAEQTPTKISYSPDQILPLLTEFEQNYPKMYQQIREHKDVRTEKADLYIRFLQQ